MLSIIIINNHKIIIKISCLLLCRLLSGEVKFRILINQILIDGKIYLDHRLFSYLIGIGTMELNFPIGCWPKVDKGQIENLIYPYY